MAQELSSDVGTIRTPNPCTPKTNDLRSEDRCSQARVATLKRRRKHQLVPSILGRLEYCRAHLDLTSVEVRIRADLRSSGSRCCLRGRPQRNPKSVAESLTGEHPVRLPIGNFCFRGERKLSEATVSSCLEAHSYDNGSVGLVPCGPVTEYPIISVDSDSPTELALHQSRPPARTGCLSHRLPDHDTERRTLGRCSWRLDSRLQGCRSGRNPKLPEPDTRSLE
jgi:hypothetical protein